MTKFLMRGLSAQILCTCGSLFTQGYFKWLSLLCSSAVTFSFLIQILRPGALEIEIHTSEVINEKQQKDI